MKLFFTIFFCSFCIAFQAHAANLLVVTPKESSVGEKIHTDILIDTEGVNINSLDMSLSFPSELFTFEGYATTEAIVPIWLIAPKEETSGVIHFSGIIPGGFDRVYDPEHPENRTAKLVQLFFKSKALGQGSFVINGSQVLRNDGLGTTVTTTAVPAFIKVIEGVKNNDPKDSSSPQPFTVSIVAKSLFGKTPRLALFAATDSEGGIEHYEAQVRHGAWHIVTSPYPLPYRLFSYTLTIRAFDFSGNYQDQSIVIPGEDPQKIVIISILLVLIIVFFVYRTRNKMLP
jgi:hypothetical protein